MRILAAADSIFRMATEHVPWSPEPTPGHYATDADWQKGHLWDHLTESGNTFGPYRGPSILHHPDLQYALDNGWRVYGGDKAIDHQTRGETGAGTKYLYKIGPSGLVHSAHLDIGPQEANHWLDTNEEAGLGLPYGDVQAGNYRHLVMGEGGSSEGPVGHDTLRDLVDDEKERSATPGGYKDFAPLPSYRGKRTQGDIDSERHYQRSVRRAWQTGTNNHSEHWNEAHEEPDSASVVDQIPRGRRTPKPNPYEDYEY